MSEIGTPIEAIGTGDRELINGLRNVVEVNKDLTGHKEGRPPEQVIYRSNKKQEHGTIESIDPVREEDRTMRLFNLRVHGKPEDPDQKPIEEGVEDYYQNISEEPEPLVVRGPKNSTRPSIPPEEEDRIWENRGRPNRSEDTVRHI
jgi:hypothetical protein